MASSLPGISTPSAEQWPAPVAVWEHTGQSGQFRARVDLIRGAGRAGAVPDVSLAYQTGNQNSIFGLGWSLNIPSFSRGDGRNLPRYRDAGPDADKFSSTEFGELVPVLVRRTEQWLPDTRRVDNLDVTRFRPRVDGSFVRIERRLDSSTGDTHWLTISRDNVTRVYGRTPGARIADPSNPRRVVRWLLEEEWDSRGNRILFEYKREDLAGVSRSSLSEQHRLSSTHLDAQLHPKRIKWGNQRPHEPGGWLFELVFDYGEHDNDTTVEHIDWTLRADAFSDYRDGFEVRTRRLCRRALLFHHMPELGASATLIRAHEFTYETTPARSLLTGITVRSYRHESTVVSETLPAVSFAYTSELPPGPVREVVLTDGRTAVAAAATLQWHNFEGNGLPGLVSREPGGAMHYRKNLGDGTLGGPQVLTSRPSLTDTPMPAAQSLEKLFGDGRSCLVDLAEGPGFQERMRSGRWSSYIPFPKTPSVPSSAAGTRNLDLDGDGRADLMLAGEFGVRWHRFNGREGWASPEEVVTSPATQTALADRTGTVLLADMTGDGLADLVQVRPGNIRYWPNLGYGRFGDPVQMAGSPFLDGPDLFDPARVRLFDIDGSGVADVIYLGRNAITCYANHSGNSFGPPRVISNLPFVTDLDSVGVVDLLGTGTSCLVWSSVSPGRADRPLRFMELVGGRQPHLLASIHNGQGLEVEVSYTTSTRLMLDDARAGRVWHSTLPSPVSLVSSIRETDLITGASQTTSWTYRHGYFDETERETRGFAFVERRETHRVPPDPGGSTFGELIPARVTRTWYHTGAHSDHAQLEDRLAGDFYRGDPGRPARPGMSVENEFGVAPRELLRSLRGRPIREEVYGVSDGDVDAHPFVTVDYSYLLRALQPSSATTSAVVAAFTQETIESTYEREPDDPRVAHRLMLEFDRLGSATRQATIAYARRRSEEPEQRRSLLTVEEQQVINRDDEPDWYRAGVPVRSRVFEVGPLGHGGVFRIEDLRRLLTSAELIDLPFEQDLPVSGPPNRRLISAIRTQYWNDELTAPAAFGTVGPMALVFEQQRAAFTDGLLTRIYGAVDRELLEGNGYVRDEGLWWARGPRFTYSPAAFYQPIMERTPLNAEHVISYDPHALFVAETRDPVGNTVRAGYDYQALAAATVTDPNGATVSTSFDAHGLPTTIAFAGARGEGDSLSAPTVRINRDLSAWQRERVPLTLRVSARVRQGEESTPWEQTVSFFDARGRELQSKRLAEPASRTIGDRWVVEKHAVVTVSGTAVRAYAPGFTANNRFSPESDVVAFPVTRSRLDALGRTVETQHAGGALTKTVPTAWRVERWDANDAVRDSPWFQIRRLAGATAQETAEADAAESHRETPTVEHLDPAGRIMLQVQNGGAAGLAQTRTTFTLTGKVKAVTDARGVLTEQRAYDMLERTLRVESVASGTARTFYDAEDKPVFAWGARGQEQRLVYDPAGRMTRREVRSGAGEWRVAERLVWGEQAPSDVAYSRNRLYLHYDGAGQLKLPAYDFRGRPLRTERTFRRDLTTATDWRAIRSVERADDAERLSIPFLSSERFVTTATYDARDRLVTRTTPDGSVTHVEYNARGLPASISVTIDGRTTVVLQNPIYDAAGRRLEVLLGNGVRETSAYDEGRGFLIGRTTIAPDGNLLRDLSFSHDAVGNVLSVTDAGQQTRYFRNAVVTPDRSFRYDALYRLIEAHGREAAVPNPPAHRSNIPPLHDVPHENDLAALRRYRENYLYDLAGNLTQLEHVAGSDGSWTIRYDIDPRADRITALRQRDGTIIPGRYEYDDAGNALALGGLNGLIWNDDDQLAQVNLEGGGTAHYVYDAAGQRAAKLIVRLDGLREERFYLDGYETFRRISPTGNVDQEETTLQVEDNEGRLLLIERRRTAADRTWTTLSRYQHSDQVGSCCLETDQAARVLTFEEFRPYGTTSYHAAQRATLPKRYRFKSCEHDAEHGLALHGVRYYASWLGRWVSPDPGGMLDGTNRYWYCRANPVTYADPTGFQAQPRIQVSNVTPQPQQPLLVTVLGFNPGIDPARMYQRMERTSPRPTPANPVTRAAEQGERERERGQHLIEDLASRINHWSAEDIRLLRRARILSNDPFEDQHRILTRARGQEMWLAQTERILQEEDAFRQRVQRDPEYFRRAYDPDGTLRGYYYEVGGNRSNSRIPPEQRVFYDLRGRRGAEEINGNAEVAEADPFDLIPFERFANVALRPLGRIPRARLSVVLAAEENTSQRVRGLLEARNPQHPDDFSPRGLLEAQNPPHPDDVRPRLLEARNPPHPDDPPAGIVDDVRISGGTPPSPPPPPSSGNPVMGGQASDRGGGILYILEDEWNYLGRPDLADSYAQERIISAVNQMDEITIRNGGMQRISEELRESLRGQANRYAQEFRRDEIRPLARSLGIPEHHFGPAHLPDIMNGGRVDGPFAAVWAPFNSGAGPSVSNRYAVGFRFNGWSLATRPSAQNRMGTWIYRSRAASPSSFFPLPFELFPELGTSRPIRIPLIR